ncbi:MAG: acyl-CoA dehydrogenase family protein [Gammaproteobacteria bacterium]
MDLSFSQEQLLLRDTAERVVRDRGGVERRRRLRDGARGFDPALWSEFAELGWLALPFAEADGGLGGGCQDLAILMEQMGRGLVQSPYLDTVVSCGALLAKGSQAQRARHIPPLLAGETQWSIACAEGGAHFSLADVTLRAVREADGWRLDGEKFAAPNAHAADWLIVSARSSGERRDAQGLSLFIVPADAAGLHRQPVVLVDGSRGAHLQLRDVCVDEEALLGPAGHALPLLDAAIARASVAMGAEALGAMEALLEQTVEYSKTRVQFGKPIGSFQALQHRMVEMYRHCQSMRSLLYHAAIAADEQRPDAQQAAAALKVKLCEAGRFVSREAVQIHGGIGMTDELAVSHYFRRLMLLNTLFGDGEHHLGRYLALGS